MDPNLEMNQLRKTNVDGKVPMTNTNDGKKLNKCNQCDFASCYASALKTHFKTHSGEMSNIYATSVTLPPFGPAI